MTTRIHRVAIAVVALMTAACSLTSTGDPSTAATVGDRVIPAAEVDDSLASIRDSEAFRQQMQGDASGQFVLDAQTQVVTTFVRSAILAQVADDADIVVTDDEVVAARNDLVEQLGGPEVYRQRIAEQGLSEEFVLQQLRDQQTQAVLQDRIGASEDLASYIRGEIEGVPIEVNPRYGQWDPTALSVVPYDPLAIAPAGGQPGATTPGSPDDGAPSESP